MSKQNSQNWTDPAVVKIPLKFQDQHRNRLVCCSSEN